MRKKEKNTILIAMDIGNTSMHAGAFVNGRLARRLRVGLNAKKEVIYSSLNSMIKARVDFSKRVIISSVVPCATERIKDILKSKFGLSPTIVGRRLKVPIKNLYKKPDKVGQDRLVNAYACKEIYGSPAIIIDFGTATTFDYINKNGEYEGGIITPGVEITINALAEKTALLPRIKLKKPKNLIGKDTTDSIRSGVINGLTCMCDGLIEKICQDRKSSPLVIATGGLSHLFYPHSRYIKNLDKDLTLKGLYLIYSKFVEL